MATARFGNQLAQIAGDVLDVGHTVVHEEHLTLAQQLAADGFGDRPLVVLADVGEDRLTFGRRRVQQGEITDAGEAHLHRARNRRGGERQHVDVGAQLLDQLLVGDSEALLLIDDEKARDP